MDGVVTGESDTRIGLSIIDNVDLEHLVEIGFDGELLGYDSEEYPDDSTTATREQTEHVHQAQQYARWVAYRDRDYETLSRRKNPDCILAGLLAVATLSESEFDDLFGDLQSQIRSHYDDSTVETPLTDVDLDGAVVYEKDLYVSPDPTEIDPSVLAQFRDRFDTDSGDSDSPIDAELPLETRESLAFDLEGVSQMHHLAYDGLAVADEARGNQPLDRDPDATVELMPFDTDEIDSFHHYVVSHLAYQLRDCFLLMGETPPTPFRSPGWGTFEAFMKHRYYPQYENYWDATADIGSWEPVP
ncbi:hypothetical protein RYH80_02615 [Halobaculum sp. MBLA0147]|uniref:hypothetical protein n=1 Tax=Halobaculum sp. MBLA0147 TaxID=3079934 RepID=UPI003525222F